MAVAAGSVPAPEEGCTPNQHPNKHTVGGMRTDNTGQPFETSLPTPILVASVAAFGLSCLPE